MTHSKTRIRIISLAVVFVAALFCVRLYYLQVIKHRDFVKLADRQYVKNSGASFDRGTIFFESKDGDLVSAATLKTGYTIAINPKILQNPEEVYTKINEVFPLEKEEFIRKADKKTDPYEEVAKRVPEEFADKITALKIPGVSLYKEDWRYYPGGKSASQLLGLIAYKDDDLAGRYGLERQYENVLGRNAEDVYANFFVEIFSNIKKSTLEGQEAEGDIVATIEPTVQSELEKTIKEIQEKWNSAETGAIIIDPKTGEIYAMGALPNFDPNDFSGEKNVSVFSNPLVEEVREMGSIIKPLTVASGLDAGVISANTTYNDSGSVTLNTETIYNFDKKGRGQITLQTALANSLNTGMVFIMQKLGRDRFTDYFYKFGLGEKTGVDLPNEAQSIVTNLESPRDIEHATASFGQGIALTPFATVRALSVLANGGVLITPHVVKEIQYKSGFKKTLEFPEPKRVISKEASDEITRMMVNVVDTTLLDGKAKNPHYTVAAKTGTAQIAKPGGGGYYEDRYLHSFVGYFPAYEPRFLVFIYTVYPKGVSFAANTLANPFLKLSKFLLSYYDIAPDR